MPGRARFAFAVLAFGYAFLYLPIALVMVYSFNESRLVTVWAGFSTKWWSALFANEAMLDAAWLSLAHRLVSATAAAIIGLAAGYVLARVPRFFGRTLFGSLVIAPMVMPEVVMGISMLLLFVGSERLFGWADRGFLTIAIAHITFSISFVAIVVQARLADFDRSLEEAAMDLGATPWVTFLTMTLPLIAPARRLGLAARLHPVARRPDPDPVRRRRAVADPADARLFQRAAGRRSADQRARHYHRRRSPPVR